MEYPRVPRQSKYHISVYFFERRNSLRKRKDDKSLKNKRTSLKIIKKTNEKIKNFKKYVGEITIKRIKCGGCSGNKKVAE
jgi:hypothetical protein